MKMKTHTPILISITIMMCFSLVVMYWHIDIAHPYHNNNQSFPFNEVGTPLQDFQVPTSILKKEFGDEYKTIMAAASRNGCLGDNALILFAIRKAENGPPGLEFGILYRAGTDLDTQAGWAAGTIIKNRARWKDADEELFGYKGFIFFLGTQYCPNNTVVWVRNVTFWYEKFKENDNG